MVIMYLLRHSTNVYGAYTVGKLSMLHRVGKLRVLLKELSEDRETAFHAFRIGSLSFMYAASKAFNIEVFPLGLQD